MTTRFQRFALALVIPILTVLVLSFLAISQTTQETDAMLGINLTIEQQNTVLLATLRLSGVPIASAGLTNGSADGSGRVAVIGATVGPQRDQNLLMVLSSAAGILKSGQVRFDAVMVAYSEDGINTTGLANISSADLLAYAQGQLSAPQLMSRVTYSIPSK